MKKDKKCNACTLILDELSFKLGAFWGGGLNLGIKYYRSKNISMVVWMTDTRVSSLLSEMKKRKHR